MEATSKKLQDVKDALNALRQEKRKTNKQLSKSVKRAVPGYDKMEILETGLMILILAKGDEKPVENFLNRRLHKHAGIAEEGVRHVAEKYAAMTQIECQQLLQSLSPAQKSRSLQATDFWQKYQLSAWVGKQNNDKRVAPRGPHIYRQLLSMRGESVTPGGHQSVLPVTRTARKRWLRRWARRFVMLRGSFSVGNRLPLPEAIEKVAG